MYQLRHWMVALAAGVVWLAPARPAQQPTQREELIAQEGAVRLVLLRQKSVQEDLKVSEAEAKKIHDFTKRQWEKAKALRERGAVERTQRFEYMARENQRFLRETLTPAQLKRLNQIAMQIFGLLWVTRPEVASELKLTHEQKTKAHELQQEAIRQLHEFYRSPDAEAKKEEIQELRRDNRRRLMSLLTDEQKAKWKEMAGERFRGEFSFEPGR